MHSLFDSPRPPELHLPSEMKVNPHLKVHFFCFLRLRERGLQGMLVILNIHLTFPSNVTCGFLQRFWWRRRIL